MEKSTYMFLITMIAHTFLIQTEHADTGADMVMAVIAQVDFLMVIAVMEDVMLNINQGIISRIILFREEDDSTPLAMVASEMEITVTLAEEEDIIQEIVLLIKISATIDSTGLIIPTSRTIKLCLISLGELSWRKHFLIIKVRKGKRLSIF